MVLHLLLFLHDKLLLLPHLLQTKLPNKHIRSKNVEFLPWQDLTFFCQILPMLPRLLFIIGCYLQAMIGYILDDG